MPIEPSVVEGAQQIVKHCLGLAPNQQLVIFADESTIEPSVALAEAADALGVSQTVFLVPMMVFPTAMALSGVVRLLVRALRRSPASA